MTEVGRSRQRNDTLARFADQALVSVGNFLVSILVARIVGPHQFGVFALFWTVVVFTLSGSWAIVVAPMQSTIPASRIDKVNHLLTSLVAITSALGLIGAGIGLSVASWSINSPLSIEVALVFCAVAFFAVVQDFSRRWLLATEHAGAALAGDMIKQAGALGALSYFRHADLTVCMSILAGTAAAGCFPLLQPLRKAAFGCAEFGGHWLQHLRVGKWLAFSVAVQSAASSVPVYALSIEAGLGVAGGYRAVFNLLAPIISLTEALETFLPLRGRQANLLGGISALRRLLWTWWWPFQTICLIFGFAVWALGPTLLSAVFGPAYVRYASLLAPLAIAVNLQFASYVLHVALRALGRARLIPQADIIAVLAMLALFVCIPIEHDLELAAVFVAVNQALKVAIWGYFARDVLAVGRFAAAN